MIVRREWVDEDQAWDIIAGYTHTRVMSELETVFDEAMASGSVRARPRELPGAGSSEYNVSDLTKWLRRPPGRPEGSAMVDKTLPWHCWRDQRS
jgi:hypothetical protein